MKIAIHVLADIFVPLLSRVGQQLQKAHGAEVAYLCFLPRDHRLMTRYGQRVHPQNLSTWDGAVDSKATPFTRDACVDMTAFMRAKLGGDIDTWVARTQTRGAYVAAYIQAESPNAFVLWNGADHVSRAISALATKHGIPVVYMENGYFPNTLQVDSTGVNASSSLCELSFEQITAATSQTPDYLLPPVPAQPVLPLALPDRVRHWLRKTLDPRYYQQFPEELGNTWSARRKALQAKAAVQPDQVHLPEQFVFLPLQVHDDTQVLLNCKHFNTVEAFFKVAHASIRRTFGPTYPIVVKEHPEDLGRYSYDAIRQAYPDVIWLRNFNIDELMRKTSCVVVINSSVGLQSIKLHKPTVIFGESFYTRPEIAFPVRNIEQADAAMAAAKQGVDEAMRQRIDLFIGQLQAHHFVSGTWKQVTPDCQSRLAARIWLLTQKESNETYAASVSPEAIRS
jgi:capsular polysaccharide export protein